MMKAPGRVVHLAMGCPEHVQPLLAVATSVYVPHCVVEVATVDFCPQASACLSEFVHVTVHTLL